jgi:hypothetical protein
MAGPADYEYKILHGRADKVEQQLNELTAQDWEFVAIASGTGGGGNAFWLLLGAAITIVLRRQRSRGG